MRRKLCTGIAGIVSLAVLSVPAALAHHGSRISYDMNRMVTVEGVVPEFDYMNPHVYFLFDVTDDKGQRDPLGSGGRSSCDDGSLRLEQELPEARRQSHSFRFVDPAFRRTEAFSARLSFPGTPSSRCALTHARNSIPVAGGEIGVGIGLAGRTLQRGRFPVVRC